MTAPPPPSGRGRGRIGRFRHRGKGRPQRSDGPAAGIDAPVLPGAVDEAALEFDDGALCHRPAVAIDLERGNAEFERETVEQELHRLDIVGPVRPPRPTEPMIEPEMMGMLAMEFPAPGLRTAPGAGASLSTVPAG